MVLDFHLHHLHQLDLWNRLVQLIQLPLMVLAHRHFLSAQLLPVVRPVQFLVDQHFQDFRRDLVVLLLQSLLYLRELPLCQMIR
jgi:uncharacterized membrane protein YcgQ (UPF0703/DUF1980 family)